MFTFRFRKNKKNTKRKHIVLFEAQLSCAIHHKYDSLVTFICGTPWIATAVSSARGCRKWHLTLRVPTAPAPADTDRSITLLLTVVVSLVGCHRISPVKPMSTKKGCQPTKTHYGPPRETKQR